MKHMTKMLAGGLALAALAVTAPVLGKPLYPNSVVSNDLEFIATSDESAFACLAFKGRRTAEMPDRRKDGLMAKQTFIFEARYTDGTSVGIWAHPDFKTKENALESVEPVAEAVGKLPTLMRKTLDHVVIHRGDAVAFGEDMGTFSCCIRTISRPASAIMILRKRCFTNPFMRRLIKNTRARKNGGQRKRRMVISSRNMPSACR